MSDQTPKVYVVTSGYWDDLSIRGVFADKRLAHQFKELGGGEDVETWELAHTMPGYTPVLRLRCAVSSYKDLWFGGTVTAYRDDEHVENRWDADAPTLHLVKIVDSGLPDQPRGIFVPIFGATPQVWVEGTDFDKVRATYVVVKAAAQAAWDAKEQEES